MQCKLNTFSYIERTELLVSFEGFLAKLGGSPGRYGMDRGNPHIFPPLNQL
jgi:hypothetical protein